jgi:hypothetical protein
MPPQLKNPPGVPDSLDYIKRFVKGKEKYIGKEFGVLIKDLDIQIRSYTSYSISRVKNSGIMISFDDQETTKNKAEGSSGAKTPVWLFVEWENPILRTDVTNQLKRAAGSWGDAEQKYYSGLVVKDIK